MEAKAKGCRQWFAICYDEIARRSWEESAFANDTSFDVNYAARTMSEAFLMEAETLYHSIEANNKHDPQQHVGFFGKGGSAKGSGKSASCFNCGGVGHSARNCPNNDHGGKSDKGKGKSEWQQNKRRRF